MNFPATMNPRDSPGFFPARYICIFSLSLSRQLFHHIRGCVQSAAATPNLDFFQFGDDYLLIRWNVQEQNQKKEKESDGGSGRGKEREGNKRRKIYL